MSNDQFQNAEVALLWRYLSASLDRFVELAAEIPNDGLHWTPPAENTNSIAVLVVHTLGNVNENILEVLCGQPVHRQRDEEFLPNDFTADELRERWHTLRPQLVQALASVPGEELDRERTHLRRGTVTGRDVLVFTTQHASEHLGQVEITRDLWLATQPAA